MGPKIPSGAPAPTTSTHRPPPTCAEDAGEHPALAVADGPEVGVGPAGQDFGATVPLGGRHAPTVPPVPLPLQHAAVVVTVHLAGGRESGEGGGGTQRYACPAPPSLRQGEGPSRTGGAGSWGGSTGLWLTGGPPGFSPPDFL